MGRVYGLILVVPIDDQRRCFHGGMQSGEEAGSLACASTRVVDDEMAEMIGETRRFWSLVRGSWFVSLSGGDATCTRTVRAGAS